jgi:hypothetical protein
MTTVSIDKSNINNKTSIFTFIYFLKQAFVSAFISLEISRCQGKSTNTWKANAQHAIMNAPRRSLSIGFFSSLFIIIYNIAIK